MNQPLVIGSGLLALALSVVVWPVTKFATTLAHEGGHALAASTMGGTVDSIRLNGDGSGATNVGGLGWFGKVFTGLAGYLGPSAFGLAGAVLLADDRVAVVLWLTLFFLVLALLQIGRIVGAVVVVAIGTIVVLVLRYASAGQQTWFAYTWVWFLLLSGFRHVITLQRLRKLGPDSRSDAYELRTRTHLPARLWSGLFWPATLVGLGYGAAILLDLVQVGG